MGSIVLDASALLAVLQREAGGEMVLRVIEDENEVVAISSVNFCEVLTRLAREGTSREDIAENVEVFHDLVVDFDLAQAEKAAELNRVTKVAGLSLGDRACIALAAKRAATVWTADRIWKQLKLDVPVRLIRE